MLACEALQLTGVSAGRKFLPVQIQIGVWGNCDPPLPAFFIQLCCAAYPPRLSYPCYNTAIHHPVKAERCRKPRDDVPFYLDQLSNRFLLSLSFTDWLIEWFVWVTFTPLFQRANKVTQHYKHFMHTVLNLCLFNLHSSLCPDFLSNIPLMSCYSLVSLLCIYSYPGSEPACHVTTSLTVVSPFLLYRKAWAVCSSFIIPFVAAGFIT